VIFQHTASASQIKTVGLWLTDLGRAHVIRVLGVLEARPARDRTRSWQQHVHPADDAVDRFRRAQLVGPQEDLGAQPHHPVAPCLAVLESGETRLLEHQADAPDLVEPPSTTFWALTGRSHRFVVGPGVRIRLTYEDEAPMRDAQVAIIDEAGQTTLMRTCERGWCIARTSGAELRVRLLECIERYA
jgi:hypothetical protein